MKKLLIGMLFCLVGCGPKYKVGDCTLNPRSGMILVVLQVGSYSYKLRSTANDKDIFTMSFDAVDTYYTHVDCY